MGKKNRYRDRAHGEALRVEAIHAAATVMSAEELDIERLWSLCVFFERYLLVGGNGTMKDFGPKKPNKAKVIRLVQPNA